MSKYARVLERLNAIGASGTPRVPSSRPDGPVIEPATALLPGSGVRRQELERLRSIVLLANQIQGLQVILVCGTRHDDGAGSVAMELALTMAEMDRTPVALADLNQGQPNVEPYMKAVLPGRHLKEVLPQGTHVNIQQTRIKNFYLVGADTGDISTMTLIQPVDVLKRLRERFKYVILNAPPVISHAETALLATRVDGVMIVAQADKSRLEDLSLAKSEFERVSANILGVILSQRKEHLPRALADRV